MNQPDLARQLRGAPPGVQRANSVGRARVELGQAPGAVVDLGIQIVLGDAGHHAASAGVEVSEHGPDLAQVLGSRRERAQLDPFVADPPAVRAEFALIQQSRGAQQPLHGRGSPGPPPVALIVEDLHEHGGAGGRARPEVDVVEIAGIAERRHTHPEGAPQRTVDRLGPRRFGRDDRWKKLGAHLGNDTRLSSRAAAAASIREARHLPLRSNMCSNPAVGLISIEVESLPVIPAGFPSPAEEHYDGPLDLNDLIRNPTATFILRVSGWSMRDAGIADGDIILVDRSVRPVDGAIVVALVDNDGFTVKTLRTTPPRLEPANPDFPTIPVPEDGIEIWGVVTTVIHRVSRGAPHAR